MSVQGDNVAKYAKAEAAAKIKEGINNDNKYGQWFGMNNQPWCAMFVMWCFSAARVKDKIIKTASCEVLEKWGHDSGLLVNPLLVQAGDVVLFDFHNQGKSVHVEIATGPIDTATHLIPTVGGNTAKDGAGSQANGDGVYVKKRQINVVRAVIHPKWDE